MSKFYPLKDESDPGTCYNFLVERKVRTMANRKSATSRRATRALKKIEALLKEKK